MTAYEELGAFYLGRPYDLDLQDVVPGDQPLLYDAKDLTTHAVCVGMTGSGQTGLGVSVAPRPRRRVTSKFACVIPCGSNGTSTSRSSGRGTRRSSRSCRSAFEQQNAASRSSTSSTHRRRRKPPSRSGRLSSARCSAASWEVWVISGGPPQRCEGPDAPRGNAETSPGPPRN